MYMKRRATDEDRERAESEQRRGDWGGRGNTWTPPPGQAIYDRQGNEVGYINDRNTGWENDRR